MPDFYGLNPSSDWKENREKHNRRVCYELSRTLAKALMELFRNNDNYSVCILYDKDLTHYFVGLTCDEYSITLDLDDFYSIKDLTRIKTGLTAEGIAVLDDSKGKFESALNKFNKGRGKHAIKKIEADTTISNPNIEGQNPNQIGEPDDIIFLRNAIEILKEKYNIDSQGLFEYIKEIVDIKLGPEARKKVWKRLEGKFSAETRYIRCLILNVGDQQYIIDADKMLLRSFNKNELEGKNRIFIPYKELSRDWGEPYDGI